MSSAHEKRNVKKGSEGRAEEEDEGNGERRGKGKSGTRVLNSSANASSRR